jgi:hypothetical protein
MGEKTCLLCGEAINNGDFVHNDCANLENIRSSCCIIEASNGEGVNSSNGEGYHENGTVRGLSISN